MIEKLLSAGADPDERSPRGETPLMFASRNGNLDAIHLLLNHNAEVNARETLRGTTPLMWAVEQRHADAVRLLVEHGADKMAVTNPDSKGGTAYLAPTRTDVRRSMARRTKGETQWSNCWWIVAPNSTLTITAAGIPSPEPCSGTPGCRWITRGLGEGRRTTGDCSSGNGSTAQNPDGVARNSCAASRRTNRLRHGSMQGEPPKLKLLSASSKIWRGGAPDW
jgi:ankyrin repeat protein